MTPIINIKLRIGLYKISWCVNTRALYVASFAKHCYHLDWTAVFQYEPQILPYSSNYYTTGSTRAGAPSDLLHVIYFRRPKIRKVVRLLSHHRRRRGGSSQPLRELRGRRVQAARARILREQAGGCSTQLWRTQSLRRLCLQLQKIPYFSGIIDGYPPPLS